MFLNEGSSIDEVSAEDLNQSDEASKKQDNSHYQSQLEECNYVSLGAIQHNRSV
jgi:hypothetical protein